MPQTQKLTQNSNKLKLVSQLGSALGWGKSAAGRTSTEKAPKAGIYAMAAVHSTPGGKADFRQQLLEIRLNDGALKYCNEKNAAPIAVKVVRVRVTGAKDGGHGFVPVYAEDALTDGKLQQTKFYMGAENVPGQIKVFVFEADAEKMKDNAAAYQEELNKEFNNTPKIEKALRRELWRHVLLERCRQKGLITADLAGLDIIQIIQVHDAFVKSGLLEELIEEREAYLQKNDLNQIDDKFLLYKRAVRDRIVKPEKDEVSGSELALMADCVQDLFNARADSDYMSGRIKTVIFCRRPGFGAEKSPAGVFDAFMRICSEHDIGGKTVNFLFKQSKEDHISQSTIETLKQLNRNLFARRDEAAVAAYFRYDKADLQETLDQVKSSILKFYQNKEYLK